MHDEHEHAWNVRFAALTFAFVAIAAAAPCLAFFGGGPTYRMPAARAAVDGGLPPGATPARDEHAGSPAFQAALNAAASGGNQNTNAAEKEAALQAVKQQATEVAQSAELHQATTSLWSQAWNKAWPFIRDLVAKFFGLFRTLWDSLKNAKSTLSNDYGGGAAANDAATNAAP